MNAQAEEFKKYLETNGIKPKQFHKKELIFNQWDPKVIVYKNSCFYVQNLDYLKRYAPKLDEWFYLAYPATWGKLN
ncbi:hypothetical protein [Listeria monocytogenes]